MPTLRERLAERIAPQWRVKREAQERALEKRRRNLYGQLTGGGVYNSKTGLGTSLDTTEFSTFKPTLIYSRDPLETTYVQSWAARKFIDIPIDDMLIRWRQWEGDDDAVIETMQDAETRHMVPDKMRQAMKAGRLYGTGLLVMVTKESRLDEPLQPERIREGDLLALHVFDRFAAWISKHDEDLMSPGYGMPEEYWLIPNRTAEGMYIHSSRVLRFDGVPPLVSDGFGSYYDRDWGVSELVAAIVSILQDATVAQAVAHLSQVASIPAVGIANLREAAAGSAPGEPTLEEIGADINEYMSIFRLLMYEKGTEEFQRIGVQFGGLDKVVDRIERRLAAAADIPVTRFFGQSPAGMNATGESDWRNYMAMVMAKREAMLPQPLSVLDEVLARDAGLGEVPDWTFPDLLELSEKEHAEIAKLKTEAAGLAADYGFITEDKGSDTLDGDSIFGNIEDDDRPDEPPEPEMPPMLPPQPVPGPMPPEGNEAEPAP